MAGVFVDAEPVAITAIDFVWLIIALFGFLICGAGWVVGWVIQIAFGRIAIFGFHPFGFIGNLIMGGVDQIEGNLVKRMKPLALGIWSVLCTAWRGLYVILRVIQYAFTYIDGSHQDAVSQVAALRAQEQADIARANTRMNNLYNSAVATEQQAVARLGLNVASIEAQLKAKEAADATAENARMDRLYNTAIATAANDLAQANTRMDNLHNIETATLAQDMATANTRMDNLYNSATAHINTVEQAIPTVALGVIAQQAPSIIARAEAALQPQLDKVNTELNDCLAPLCDTVTPNAQKLGNLGKGLQALEALGEVAFIITIAELLLTDPKATIDGIDTVVHDVGDPFVAAFQHLIGG